MSAGADATGGRLGSPEDLAAVYAAVVESALDAVVVVDESGAVLALNPAAEATFGYSGEEAIGRSIGALIVPDHLKSAHEAGMARYLATRTPHVLGRRVEMEARCKDGRIIPVELAITEVRLPGRTLFTANLRDLSPAREAAAQIERQRDTLHQNEKLAAIGSLLAGVAHELNNPLSIILGQATMLREEAEVDKANGGSARAAKIEAAAERCARIVRSFLSIARQRKAERRVVSVAPILDEALALLEYAATSSGTDFVRDYDETLPPIFADPELVQHVLVNLVVNATQALETFDGERRITIAVRPDAEGTMRVRVSDSGPGVPAHLAERIFEPFVTTKPQGVGTGIGLSISRGLAEGNGGRLVLLRDQAPGATFELTLPLARDAASVIGPGSVQNAEPPSPGALRAIVIDDEAGIAELLAEVLEKHGYACDIARSGRQAQVLIDSRAGGYDAVVCDLRMPDMDGPTLFGWLGRHYPSLADRTLFVTGDALGSAVGQFLAECGRPVLEKPFLPEQMVQLVAGFRSPVETNETKTV